METLPLYIYGTFVPTVLAAAYIFSKASHTRWLFYVFLGWMALTAALAWGGFFTVTDTLPPRFLVAVLPPLLGLIAAFCSPKGRAWLDTFDLKTLTLLQVMRIPVELVLFWLFLHQLTPELMTFQGRNLDIVSGITAPLVYYLAFVRNKWRPELLIGWNIVALGLLIFTVSNGVLSAPSPFQQFAFEQPNVAVLLFPFIWLPAVVVPIAYSAHIISIRQLWKAYRRNRKFIYNLGSVKQI
ncbi:MULTISPECIES: hypothetical protein [Pontibacter]|uniref:Uncharacterized protein n=1 Tax=Pontibacter lucknowensis TaxID=1077936 RepID=A0A1N7AP48_9BACT|nr:MULTISPECIES: hypothetical protein [Pontibacter]EJF08291.1 hypothetical protein O71_21767 [Pontibacter sp. BAB1700]SIR40796.1 hypothetical protein SAMN05421545_3467 [Pontibacter lucknowensis]